MWTDGVDASNETVWMLAGVQIGDITSTEGDSKERLLQLQHRDNSAFLSSVAHEKKTAIPFRGAGTSVV